MLKETQMIPCPKEELKLTDKYTHDAAAERLATYLPLQASGYECTPEAVLDVLIKAAAAQQTIECICNDLDEMVSGETIRSYLNEQIQIDDLGDLERRVNQALVAGLPRRLSKPKLQIAVDLHDEPFYGHTPKLSAFACRGPAKKGTTRFFRLATAYVIFKDMRVTLVVLFVRPEDKLPDLVAAILRRLRVLGLKMRRLYFDKAFCTIPVLRYVEKSGWPAILACPIRGKKGGTRGLCHGRASYQTRHTFASQMYGDYTAPITVVRTYTSRKRSTRGRRRATWLVFVALNCTLTPRSVRKCYRRRFGIETSYRCMRQVRAWTTSRNAALRFLLMSVGFILVNLWLELRWRFCQVKQRRGPRKIDIKRFELQRMLAFLNRAIERIYGVVSFIEADVEPLGV
jgi:putative transposase